MSAIKSEIEAELLNLADLEPEQNVHRQHYLAKLITTLNEVLEDDPGDEKWDSLSESAQDWCNEAVDAWERYTDIPEFPDLSAIEQEPQIQEEEKSDTSYAKQKSRGNRRRRWLADARRDYTIEILVNKNPKRKGSKAADRFGRYKPGMTVQEALDVKIGKDDIEWDVNHEFIALHPPQTKE